MKYMSGSLIGTEFREGDFVGVDERDRSFRQSDPEEGGFACSVGPAEDDEEGLVDVHTRIAFN